MTPTPVGMRCPECARQRTRVVTARTMSGVPRVTYALIAANVIVFLAEIGTGVQLLGGLGNSSVIRNFALSRFTVAQGDWWRLVTSGFLHANLIHIGFNMYVLYVLGMMLEPAIGSFKFALIYFVSLLAGSFGALLLSSEFALTLGASGAVFGLAGAGVMVMRSRGLDPMQSGLPVFIGINLLFSVTFAGISIGGHIGGLIGGALAAVVLFDIGERRRGMVPAAVPLLLAAAIGVACVIGSLAVAHSGA